MMALEIARLMASPQGMRLYKTLKRLVEAEGIPVDEVMGQSVDHMEKMEAIARRTGRTVRQVAEESLTLYEAQLGG